MPTSGPGSRRRLRRAPRCGFTLVELLVVLALVALATSVVSLAVRDPEASRLEEEGERLAMLLEMARAEARAGALPVRWVPTDDPSATSGAHFRFVGLPQAAGLPQRWLDARVTAQVPGGALVLGPDAILPPQRLVLRLEDRRLELASDGLAPFAPLPARERP